VFDVRDHVVLMSGASGALGSALAQRLLAAGARVAAIERRPDALAHLLAQPAAPGGIEPGSRLLVHRVDFAERETIEHAVADTVARWGRLDHLFNTTGAWGNAPSLEATPDALWDAMWDANVRPVLETCRAAVPLMKKLGGGTIVNVGARTALAGDAGVGPYAVAKAAVVRLTETLAAEGRSAGIRANCVLPSTIDTPANRAAMPDADRSGWVSLDALVDAMLFLASPAARAIHGVALPVYGPG
jgi:NAD(P)-dependent dehydrogenase (short-subunit alcohol dehydrogenase family)